MRRNAFAARPKKFRGRGMHGVITHPGFHTTDAFGVACTYAHAKVDDLLPGVNQMGGILSRKKPWRYPIHDYPVVVSLVMNGLQRLPDYDAHNYWAGPVEDTLRDFEQWGKGRTFEDFVDYVDRSEFESQDSPDDIADALCQILDAYPSEHAGYRIRDFLEAQPDPDRALLAVLREPANPVLLMHVCQQYRYLEDVHERRICAVDYMRPFFRHLLPYYEDPEWEEDRWEEKKAAIERAGYATVSLGNVYDSQDPVAHVRVYEVPPESIMPGQEQELMPWGSYEPRVEYHGTSYVNLVSAAPKLARRLPRPPPPYEES